MPYARKPSNSRSPETASDVARSVTDFTGHLYRGFMKMAETVHTMHELLAADDRHTEHLARSSATQYPVEALRRIVQAPSATITQCLVRCADKKYLVLGTECGAGGERPDRAVEGLSTKSW